MAVLSMEAYEQMVGRFELYGLLQEGLEDVAQGRVSPAKEAMGKLREIQV